MTVTKLKKELALTILAGETGMNREVTGCYIGDLLSWVMGRAPADAAWITVMGNVNAIAVARLADLGCIILCESASLDEEARAQAELNGIPVLLSELPAYPLGLALARLLGEYDAAAV